MTDRAAVEVPVALTAQAHAVVAEHGRAVEFYATCGGHMHPWMIGWSTRSRAGCLIGQYDEPTVRRCLGVLEAAGLRVVERVSVRLVSGPNVEYVGISAPPAGAVWRADVGREWSTGRAGDDTGRAGDQFMRERDDAGGWRWFARVDHGR